MWKHYLKSTLRHLGNKKGYAFINLTGLTLGLVCFAAIGFWVSGQIGYDRFHANSDRIYRVASSVETESDRFDQAVTSSPVAPAMLEEFSMVEEAVRFDKNDAIVQSDRANFKEDDILLTDPGFFRMFDFQLLQGNPETALNEPYSIILSRTMANKYFGETNPMGKSLTLYLYDPDGTGAEYTVTGVVEDAPSNSHIRFNFLISFTTMEVNFPHMVTGGWFENSIYTYLLLEEGADPDAVESQFPNFAERNMGQWMRQYGMHYNYRLQSFGDIYLRSNLRYELSAGGDFAYVLLFSAIGLFILLLAGINYINLSTAFAIDRMKDAAVRKTNGATRSQLVLYYLFEAVVLTGIACCCTLLFIELFGSSLASRLGLEEIYIGTGGIVYLLGGASLVIGLLSGLFPAFYLSTASPIKSLKNNPSALAGGSTLRSGLIIAQFTITILLLTGIFTVNSQLDFIRDKDLGYSRDGLLILNVNGSDEVLSGFEEFRNELVGMPSVHSVARSNTGITGGFENSQGSGRDLNGNEIQGTVFRAGIDYDFIPTYDLTLLAGRNYSPNFPSDSSGAFIVNEATVRQFGWGSPDQAIGKPFEFMNRSGTIIGVVRNFHFTSLHNRVQPVSFFLLGDSFSKISVRTGGLADSDFLSRLESAWSEFFPGTVFEYEFVDDRLAQQYRSEAQLERLLTAFSLISLFISCIGLYGLAGFSSSRRRKEIGIHKVLGATTGQITLMLNAEYLKLVSIAFLAGSAGGVYMMSRWLRQLAYRTEVEPWFFLVSGAIALTIAFVAVSGQAIRAALINPVESLRSE